MPIMQSRYEFSLELGYFCLRYCDRATPILFEAELTVVGMADSAEEESVYLRNI